ncbi:hypothetical protein CXP39_02780 [Mesoplasma syrphidae]|uniref:Bifunctional chitinase/lysozyme n=1 Tax=Mesoplasma syrphidae TaxID=225999 RepID=A0A2K9C2K4_9MOLU|nr:hypothetical protein [Mesoplasma syrphidae]AUF83709.1 hypothetical protein CXP39_02780 [Mesoplasma syrphidae]
MKKLLTVLGVVTITVPLLTTTVSCFSSITPIPKPEKNDGFETGDKWKGQGNLEELYKIKEQSVKNQKWQEVLKTDYSQKVSRTLEQAANPSDKSTLADKNILQVEDKLQFTPYADMGIVEDTAEYLMKEKGRSSAARTEAMESLEKHKTNNIVYNDLGEIAGKKDVITDSSEITLGFMQNASDTGELVPMWNAAPAKGNQGILADEKDETEYAKWFNDRYRNWTGTTGKQTKWEGNENTGHLNSDNLRISFGPFANSLWHTAWQNNKTPEQLAGVLEKISEKYETKKFDFYFAAPYLSASGNYADSQRLLASALKILVEKDIGYDVQLSLVMSTKDGVAISDGFLETGSLKLLGDEAFPLYNFTKYLGMNFRLNLVAGYLTVPNEITDPNWVLETTKAGVLKTHINWQKMHRTINNGSDETLDKSSRKVKVTPWIGRRAEQAAYNFTPKNALDLRKWAESEKLGGIGMFYISRDAPSYFDDNGLTGPAQADQNALNQNVRSGSGFEQFTYAKALNGTILEDSDIPQEAKSVEDVIKIGGIDYQKDIQKNTDLDNPGEGSWEGPGIGGPGQGAGGAGETEGSNPPPPTGPGKSMYSSWEEANPNRTAKVTKQEQANPNTYFSPYLDAGLYQGNDMKEIMTEVPTMDHLTLAFVQQVNHHGDAIEMSIAGQAKDNEGYTWWEETQLWGKMLKPLAESNNFENIKVAYGGATTGGFTEKNPWTLANKLNPGNSKKAQEDLTKALVGYQQELVGVAKKYGTTDVKMPKAIDFDIEGHAQELNEDNRLLARTIAKMKVNDQSWDFSVTLPVLPTGLTSVGYNVMNIFIEEFQKAGLGQQDLPVINLMLMDYGDPIYAKARDSDKITNFELAKNAINSTKNNLATSIEANYGQVSIGNSGLYQLIGATPMIGVNDTVHGVFTLEDAKDLYNWAHLNGLAYIGTWSMNDDRGRDIYSNKPVVKSLTSHGLAYLEAYDFARALSGHWTDGVLNPNK